MNGERLSKLLCSEFDMLARFDGDSTFPPVTAMLLLQGSDEPLKVKSARMEAGILRCVSPDAYELNFDPCRLACYAFYLTEQDMQKAREAAGKMKAIDNDDE